MWSLVYVHAFDALNDALELGSTISGLHVYTLKESDNMWYHAALIVFFLKWKHC